MSEAKPTPGLLHNGQVFALNAKHGWFEYGDAQSDVSRAFAADAIAEYERVRNEATAICVQTGLTPSQLVERVKELEEVLQAAVDCGMVPKSSAADGGASKYSAQVLVADRIRAALSKARPNTAAVAGPLASDDEMFEFWWADRMPEATQSEAWAEWCALRSDKPETSP